MGTQTDREFCCVDKSDVVSKEAMKRDFGLMEDTMRRYLEEKG